jgi:Phage portal protein, lambda family
MIANLNGARNGHAQPELVERLFDLDRQYFERRQNREPASWYKAGTVDRMNPVPKGVHPLGTDADYHYRTEFNYFLMVERGRQAVRNHPLVEQGINRLVANMRLGDYTLDIDSGDPGVDQAIKDYWADWSTDPRQCDYEQRRTFQQIARQSFFSQVADGDIVHLPLFDGSLQTWEAHHLRNPWGRMPTGSDVNGIIHGVEVINGRTTAYWITPRNLLFNQTVQRGEAQRFPAFDSEGNKIVFWLGFAHRFSQRRGISRLSAPREPMNGFDDLNFANIKSSLRRALISYLMAETSPIPGNPALGGGRIPQGGDRYTEQGDLGLQTRIVEQMGEPAQVMKAPPGYTIEGWNADMPPQSFFDHAALMLTMLAVNLDLPLSFLLLDGSLVNFHGGRMTWDQMKLRLEQLILDQIQGLNNPTCAWKIRQLITPGAKQFDRAIAAAVARGAKPLNFLFRPRGWPYCKPLEDAAAEDLIERRNLKSMKAILAARGTEEDEHYDEVVAGRGKFIRKAIAEAQAIQQEFPEVVKDEEIPKLWREIRYGNEVTGAELAISADPGGGEPKVAAKTAGPGTGPKPTGGSSGN